MVAFKNSTSSNSGRKLTEDEEQYGLETGVVPRQKKAYGDGYVEYTEANQPGV